MLRKILRLPQVEEATGESRSTNLQYRKASFPSR